MSNFMDCAQVRLSSEFDACCTLIHATGNPFAVATVLTKLVAEEVFVLSCPSANHVEEA
jgi:hypothetical protein